MFINEELMLLVKSKYPVIYLESIDEEYATKQLEKIADGLGMLCYKWSVTEGLKRGEKESSYYQTQEPVRMLRTVLDFAKEPGVTPGLIILKDFHKYLDDVIVLRLFRDLVGAIRNTKNTVVITAAEYKLPKEIESDAAHIVTGYPSEKEIANALTDIIYEFKTSVKKVMVTLAREDTAKMARALKGLSMHQIKNVLNQCVADDNILDIKDLANIETYKKKIFDQEALLEFCISESRDYLADFDNLKRWLADRKGSFSGDAAGTLPPPKGIMLMGVQGCGKSLAIKVVARELNLPIYRLDIGGLYSKYIGETEQNLKKVLMIVEKLCPLCLWIDEIEKGFAASGGEIDGGVSQRILGTFLTWMQERKGGCFLAATANNIRALPPEFLRKGRFDETFFVDLPDKNARESLFKIHFSKRGLETEKFDCALLADKAADFSGAEIEQAVISALYKASGEKTQVTTETIIEGLRSTKPLAALKREDVLALREWAKGRTIPA
ncbi:MAG: AAA family ATPase [Candidatus Omnitrophica bacterium]|nr:AAA family ATPase [Candidatus Omnitrophota bacterium]